MPNTKQPPGTERARDEAREDGGPRAAGGPWEKMDERGDQRFGHTRADDANPLELTQTDEEQELASETTETGGERAGFGNRGEPHKIKEREKPNPKPNTKTKQGR